MTKLRWKIILVILCGWMVRMEAQNMKDIVPLINDDDFGIIRTGEDLYRIGTGNGDYFFKNNNGQPALPFRTLTVLMPHSAVFADLSVDYEMELVQEGIRIGDGYKVITTGDRREIYPTVSRDTVFSGHYPEKIAAFNFSQVQRGYTYFYFTFSPFYYDTGTRSLYRIRNPELHITYRLDNQDKSPVRPVQNLISASRKIVNPEDYDRFYPVNTARPKKAAGDEIDYLIITSKELRDAFAPLLEWKYQKGLRTHIVTLDEIYSAYDEPTPQLEIKRYLYDQYLDHNLKWVLLGGDQNVVPVQYCYGYVDENLQDNTIPTDLFYACFDKRFDWNSYQDNRVGEIFRDANDVLPEIYISRIPVRTTDDVKVFVDKTLRYEKAPPVDELFEKMLLVGVKSYTAWDNMSDNHHRSEIMFRKYIEQRWNGTKKGYYDTGTDFPGGESYDVSASNLISRLNEGYGFFHFAGHGNSLAYMMEDGPSFSIVDASSLHGSGMSVMLSTTCDVNAFDLADPCLSEVFLRNPDGGCVAFFGSSRYGLEIINESANLGPSFQFNAKFFELLFSEPHRSGTNSFAFIANTAKTNFADHGAYWYLMYALNPMGDPELPLYTRIPLEFNNVRIFRWGENLTVNTGGVPGCRISLTGGTEGSGFRQVADDVSWQSFSDCPVPCTITITKPGYIPYVRQAGSLTGTHPDISSFVRIYPNPASSFVNVGFSLPEGSFSVLDMRGVTLLEGKLIQGVNHISLENLPDNFYILRVRTPQGTGQFKLIRNSSEE